MTRKPMQLLAVSAALAAFGSIGTASALADSLTLQEPYAPAAEIPSVVKFAAQATPGAFSTYAYIKYRPAGGAPCAPTPTSDSGDYIVNGASVNGATTIERVRTFDSAGQLLICGWIADSSGNRVSATLSQQIAVRAPVGSLAVAVPALAPLNRSFVITFSGQTEVKRYVFARIRPAGGPACAPTYGADTGDGVVNGGTAEGAFSLPRQATLSTRGTFTLCSWLARNDSDLAPLATATATFTNVPPVILSPKPIVSSVKIKGRKLRTTVGLSKGGRIVVRLIGKGRRIGIGAVNASGPRTVVISYTRPKSVKTGRYTLEMTFTAKGANRASVQRRSVILK